MDPFYKVWVSDMAQICEIFCDTLSSDAVGFEIGIGLDESDLDGLIKKPLALNKVNTISVQLIQLRGRTLSVAAAKFAEQIGAAFMAMSGEKVDGPH